MRRRALLASLATTLTAGAGCLGPANSPPAAGGATTRSTTPTDTATATPTDDTGTDTPDDPATRTPSPPPASDAFSDFECPSFDETARTVCYHEAGETAPLVLTAEPEVFDPDTGDDTVETLEFALYNRSETSVGFNPYDWGIERYDDGEWTHVAPEMTPEPWTTLPSGETFTWSLSSIPHPSPNDEQRQPVDVALDPGIYAFHVSVAVETDDTETATSGSMRSGRTELIALFEIRTSIGEKSSDDGGLSTEMGS